MPRVPMLEQESTQRVTESALDGEVAGSLCGGDVETLFKDARALRLFDDESFSNDVTCGIVDGHEADTPKLQDDIFYENYELSSEISNSNSATHLPSLAHCSAQTCPDNSQSVKEKSESDVATPLLKNLKSVNYNTNQILNEGTETNASDRGTIAVKDSMNDFSKHRINILERPQSIQFPGNVSLNRASSKRTSDKLHARMEQQPSSPNDSDKNLPNTFPKNDISNTLYSLNERLSPDESHPILAKGVSCMKRSCFSVKRHPFKSTGPTRNTLVQRRRLRSHYNDGLEVSSNFYNTQVKESAVGSKVGFNSYPVNSTASSKENILALNNPKLSLESILQRNCEANAAYSSYQQMNSSVPVNDFHEKSVYPSRSSSIVSSSFLSGTLALGDVGYSFPSNKNNTIKSFSDNQTTKKIRCISPINFPSKNLVKSSTVPEASSQTICTVSKLHTEANVTSTAINNFVPTQINSQVLPLLDCNFSLDVSRKSSHLDNTISATNGSTVFPNHLAYISGQTVTGDPYPLPVLSVDPINELVPTTTDMLELPTWYDPNTNQLHTSLVMSGDKLCVSVPDVCNPKFSTAVPVETIRKLGRFNDTLPIGNSFAYSQRSQLTKTANPSLKVLCVSSSATDFETGAIRMVSESNPILLSPVSTRSPASLQPHRPANPIIIK